MLPAFSCYELIETSSQIVGIFLPIVCAVADKPAVTACKEDKSLAYQLCPGIEDKKRFSHRKKGST